VLSLLSSLITGGCAGAATYGENRVRDLSDVVDVRYGIGFGLGVCVQATPFKTGLGCSTEWYYREWFGRKSVEVREGIFAHALIMGYDGDSLWRHEDNPDTDDGDSSTGSISFLIFGSNGHNGKVRGYPEWFEEPGGVPPSLAAGRIGGVAFLPGVSGGLYFNFGEFIDFACGLVAYDLMHDDGYSKFFTPDSSEAEAAFGMQGSP